MIPRLHVVTDDRILSRSEFDLAAEACLVSGAERIVFHLRGPRTPARRLWNLGLKLRPISKEYGVPFIVNDRVDLALALATDGVQLGIRSIPAADTRKLLGPESLIGCSVHSTAEAVHLLNAEGRLEGSPDFLLVGALFATPSHPERTPLGKELIAAVGASIPSIPLVGIGGLTRERVREVLGSGSHGVAVLSGVWDAPDPAAAVSGLLQELDDCTSIEGAVQGVTRDG